MNLYVYIYFYIYLFTFIYCIPELVNIKYLDLGQAYKAVRLTEKPSVWLCLPADISNDAVREHFAVCGGVVAVRIVRDRKTGLGKGFGYVLFEVCVSGVRQDAGSSSKSELGFAFIAFYFFFLSYFFKNIF